MLTKGKINHKRCAQPKKTLDEYLKKTFPSAGYTKEWNSVMYKKFEELFGEHF